MFSKTLIEYTEKTLNEEKISLRTKTMVKRVTDKFIEAEITKPDGSKELQILPYGCLIWATGNAVRPVTRDFMAQLPAQKNSRRGLAVNEYLVVDGTDGIWAIGDCSATKYAPTAQVASQQGAFLARLFNNMAKTLNLEQELQTLQELSVEAQDDRESLEKEIQKKQKLIRKVKQLSAFEYTHQGSLAYIGMERAVADISWWNGNFASGGGLTYLFWRSAYLSMCFSTRNRILVAMDWVKVKVFGRDVSRYVPACFSSLGRPELIMTGSKKQLNEDIELYTYTRSGT
jgi:NADH:ubiquinone reductase (non-electrogenic)